MGLSVVYGFSYRIILNKNELDKDFVYKVCFKEKFWVFNFLCLCRKIMVCLKLDFFL